MRISDWSSDVCSSDLRSNQIQAQFQPVGFFGIDGEADALRARQLRQLQHARGEFGTYARALGVLVARVQRGQLDRNAGRCEQIGERAADRKSTSELQSLMRISYAVFCLKKKKCNK